MHRPPRLLAPTQGCLALLALSGLGAAAQTSPYLLGVSETVTHDSNLYRLADGAAAPGAGRAKADTIYTTSLLAAVDQPIGRQRLRADARLRDSRFVHNEALDNSGYGLKLGWDWATVERLSGSVNLAADRSLVRFNNDSIAGTTLQRNIATTRQADFTARIGLVTRWSAETTLAHERVDYSAAAYASREVRQNSLSAGVRYTPGAVISLGVGLRGALGRYPRFALNNDGSALADRYRGRHLDLSARWLPSAISTLDARISLGDTRFDRATARDISGLTGSATWLWRPSGKLRLETRLARDRGLDSAALGFAASGRIADFSRTTSALSLGLHYEWSAKFTLVSGAGLAWRELVDMRPDALGSTVVTRGSDRTTQWSLGARWAPTRSVTLGCDLGREQRSASSALSNDMSAATFGCHGQLAMQ